MLLGPLLFDYSAPAFGWGQSQDRDVYKRQVYNGMYYQIGEEHKEFCAEKTQDEDYYVLTLAAIARELDGKGTVSYTHLDVYKRQICTSVMASWLKLLLIPRGISSLHNAPFKRKCSFFKWIRLNFPI